MGDDEILVFLCVGYRITDWAALRGITVCTVLQEALEALENSPIDSIHSQDQGAGVMNG
ncbi:hypothetical protein GDO81_003351 [Engystomops pustulosus]|uniref:Uncharacterized protein n=1 Tax=Engystomops pustulosus TaxID=76066 RepID=A0AAV6ZVG1_ENGPU|nr:hypothetical protein GDO81_003351 [Engystomops pustulosus]